MGHDYFRAGEQVWLRGQRVTFVDHHRYAPHRTDAAVVRRRDETVVRVDPLWKLTRDREESLARADAIPVRYSVFSEDSPRLDRVRAAVQNPGTSVSRFMKEG
jgi:hypothetical protein